MNLTPEIDSPLRISVRIMRICQAPSGVPDVLRANLNSSMRLKAISMTHAQRVNGAHRRRCDAQVDKVRLLRILEVFNHRVSLPLEEPTLNFLRSGYPAPVFGEGSALDSWVTIALNILRLPNGYLSISAKVGPRAAIIATVILPGTFISGNKEERRAVTDIESST